MKYTEYLNLKLPQNSEKADVADLNDNTTMIDAELERIATQVNTETETIERSEFNKFLGVEE